MYIKLRKVFVHTSLNHPVILNKIKKAKIKISCQNTAYKAGNTGHAATRILLGLSQLFFSARVATTVFFLLGLPLHFLSDLFCCVNITNIAIKSQSTISHIAVNIYITTTHMHFQHLFMQQKE